MSFVRHRLGDGPKHGMQPESRYKTCSKCKESRPPEGGIDMGPQRWVCAVCWTKKATQNR